MVDDALSPLPMQEPFGDTAPRAPSNGTATPSKHGPPHKNALSQEARRDKLRAYLDCGINNQSELARLLGVHRNTVQTDLKWLRDQDRDRILQGDAHQILGDTDRFLTEVEGKAMELHTTAADPKVRADALKMARDTRLSRVELLFKTGAIPRVDTAQDYVRAQEYRSMSTEQIRERARTMLLKLQYDLQTEDDVLRPRTPGDAARLTKTAADLAAGSAVTALENSYPPPPPEEESKEEAERYLQPRNGASFHAVYTPEVPSDSSDTSQQESSDSD